MSKNTISRRHFMATTAVGSVGAMAGAHSFSVASVFSPESSKPALLGGKPVRSERFPRWPIWDNADEEAVIPVLRSGVWSRQDVVNAAEAKFAELMGTKRCLLTETCCI